MALQPDESSKSPSAQEEKELLLQWWKNYIVFACATVTVPEGSFVLFFY